MGEIKSVKVDNWGVFFLQKLQNFFNKTDYCDLTLQFRDNSQLKVHRLVLSACTDYFNVLEQTCETIDDALIMPFELQADVVVPIVNFMYTGTLEFELKMYGKLLRTAKEMNMTVLLKLLEAHRRTMEGVSRSQRPPSPRGIRRRIQQNTNANNSSRNQSPVPRRSVTSNASPAVQQQATRTIQVGRSPTPATGTPIRHQLGSGITILKTSSTANRQVGGASTSTGASSSSSAREEGAKQEPASPFEQLRKGYSNNKRPPSTSIVSPPSKKPNLEDVKEFAEQQRMRKQIAAEYGEDQEGYDQIMDDAGIHNDDDDDEEAAGPSNQGASTSRQSQQQLQATQANQAARPNDCNTIVSIRHEGPDRQPTIIVRENGNSKLNHTKIIQEVLRKYPHLVKGSKNIKLKILPSEKNTRAVAKREETENAPAAVNASPPPTLPSPKPSVSKPAVTISPVPKNTIKTEAQSSVSTATLANPPKILKQQTISTAAGISGALTTDSSGKKRIDSKTMYALIALGAENRTGPWLCLRCGVNNRPISIPSYRGFRRHLINTHHEEIDPALCEHCGWRSQNDRNLHFHMQVEHKIKSNYFSFEECSLCSELLEDNNALSQHMTTNHPDEKQQCIYCNKVFTKEIELYTHMKTLHKNQALEDGIIDASEDEYSGSQDEEEEKKVQILSDITLPGENKFIKHVGGGSDEAAHTSGVNGNVTTTKFVTADGSEVILTDEQRKQIMSQLNQDVENGSVVMFLNESTSNVENYQQEAEMANAAESQDVVMEATSINKEEAPTYDDSQIYEEMNNAPKDGEVDKNESKGSLENLAWAEHFISSQENQEQQQEPEHIADEEGDDLEENDSEKLLKVEDQAKKQQDIDKKLKELAVDWTYDEDDEEEDNLEQNTKEEEQKESNKSDNKTETTEEADEDDIDLALKNLHKENTGLMEQAVEGDEDSQEGVIERLDDDIKTDDDDASQPETMDADEKMDLDDENDDNVNNIQNNAEFLKADENSFEELGGLEHPSDEANVIKEDENDDDQVVEGNNDPELPEEESAQNELIDDLIDNITSNDSQDDDHKNTIALGVLTESIGKPEIETLGTVEPVQKTDIEPYKNQDEADPMADAGHIVEENIETLGESTEIVPSTRVIEPEAESEQITMKGEDEKVNQEYTPGTTESAKTPDAVKSLMSDWADDIEEDEEDEKNASH